MDINQLEKEYQEVCQQESLLADKIASHYHPIIDELRDNKDILGLESLIDSIPDVYSIKVRIYQVLRQLKNH